MMLKELKKKNPELPEIEKTSMYQLNHSTERSEDRGDELLRRYERLNSFMKKETLTKVMQKPNTKFRRWVSMRHTLPVRRTPRADALAELKKAATRNRTKATTQSPVEFNLSFVTAMMDQIAQREIIDKSVCLSIVKKAKSILSKETNVMQHTVKKGCRVTIVGDIHGQIPDLLHIFHLNGLPSARNSYIFNGDWVDRGIQGCEVVLVIFAFKILFPRNVFLNRGNHEAVDINDFSGFLDECRDKYDEEVYYEFNEAFSTCPLATIIDEKVFVVHGGLPRVDMKVNSLYQINRKITEVDYEHPDHCILADLIWSDPEEYLQGRVPNTRRGAGQLFGPDVLAKFLALNDFHTVVRSHEAKQEGYEYLWGERLITVFSASNYCGSQGNDGAVLVYEHGLTRKIISWNLSNTSLLAVSGTYSRFNFRVSTKKTKNGGDSVKSILLKKLSKIIQDNRLPLIDSFEKVSKNGVIQRSVWANVLKEVLELEKVPFLMFQRLLGVPFYGVDAKHKGPIDYMQWLLHFNDLSKRKKKSENERSKSFSISKKSSLSERVSKNGSLHEAD